MKALMSMWTIYRSPSDYPGQYVARRWEIVPGLTEPQPTQDVRIAPDREELDEHFRDQGLHFLERSASDEPQIVGVYL